MFFAALFGVASAQKFSFGDLFEAILASHRILPRTLHMPIRRTLPALEAGLAGWLFSLEDLRAAFGSVLLATCTFLGYRILSFRRSPEKPCGCFTPERGGTRATDLGAGVLYVLLAIIGLITAWDEPQYSATVHLASGAIGCSLALMLLRGAIRARRRNRRLRAELSVTLQ